MPRSDMFHSVWWVASVCSVTKSQNVSWALCACGISRSGCGLPHVDDVGELDRVLDEEHRDVVADQIEDTLTGVELRREAPGVPDRVRGAARAQHGGEAHEDRRLDIFTEERGLADPLRCAVTLEDAMGGCAAGVHDPLRDAFVVEMRDLLAQVVVLQQHWAPRPCLQRVVGVVQSCALRGGQEFSGLRHLGLRDARRLPGGAVGVRAALIGLGLQRACTASVGSSTGAARGLPRRGVRFRGERPPGPSRRPCRLLLPQGSSSWHSREFPIIEGRQRNDVPSR